MSSWYSNLLTKTSSQISSLRTLLSSEADGDSDDDTHVCRVLRNYYVDKNRPCPPWLPPDPKANSTSTTTTALPSPQPSAGLGSLWDSSPHQHQAHPPLQVQTQSLRAGRAVFSPVAPGSRTAGPGAVGAGSSTPVAGTAQDRLRQRLWGGARTTSPAHGGPFQPPESPDDERPYMAANAPWVTGG